MVVMGFNKILGGALKIDGILGMTNFSDYLVTLDYPGKTIMFEEETLQENMAVIIPYTKMHGIISLNFTINGKEKKHFSIRDFPVHSLSQ